MGLRIVRKFNHFGQLGTSKVVRLDAVVRETAVIIRDNGFSNAPVDTAALMNSGYVSLDIGSDYQQAADIALALRHEGNRPDSPAVQVQEVNPTRLHQAIVGSAVAHAVYNEFGTSRMAARPFLVPAVEAESENYFRKIAEILGDTKTDQGDDMDGGETDMAGEGAAGGVAGAISAGGEGALVEAAPLLLL